MSKCLTCPTCWEDYGMLDSHTCNKPAVNSLGRLRAAIETYDYVHAAYKEWRIAYLERHRLGQVTDSEEVHREGREETSLRVDLEVCERHIIAEARAATAN